MVRKIAYWVSTALLSASLAGAGLAYLVGAMDAEMAHLGYPPHFVVLLGLWKVVAAAVLLAPRTARPKEWAYAGVLITFSSAVVAHLAVGDGAMGAISPALCIGVAVASYLLRPAARRVAGGVV